MILQNRINRIQNNNYGSNVTKDNNIRELTQEIAERLQQQSDVRADKRRSIPLQYWRGKYVCGACLDRLVRRAR